MTPDENYFWELAASFTRDPHVSRSTPLKRRRYFALSTMTSELRTRSAPISSAHFVWTGRVLSRNAFISAGESWIPSMP